MKRRELSALRNAASGRKRPGPDAGFRLGLYLWLAATVLAAVSARSYAAPLVALSGWLALCVLLARSRRFKER